MRLACARALLIHALDALVVVTSEIAPPAAPAAPSMAVIMRIATVMRAIIWIVVGIVIRIVVGRAVLIVIGGIIYAHMALIVVLLLARLQIILGVLAKAGLAWQWLGIIVATEVA